MIISYFSSGVDIAVERRKGDQIKNHSSRVTAVRDR